MQVDRRPRLPVTALLFALLLLLLGAAIVGCHGSPVVIIYARRGAVSVPVELAVTDQQRARGLMYRQELSVNKGMLFVFPETREHPFWMKNTPLSLDIIFIGETATIVGILTHTRPFSTKSLSIGLPSRYVLEVRAGFSERNAIRIGDRVEFQNVPLSPKS